MIKKLISLKPKFIDLCNESLLPEEMKHQFILLIETRMEIFE